MRHLKMLVLVIALAACSGASTPTASTFPTHSAHRATATATIRGSKIKCSAVSARAERDPIVFHDTPEPTGHMHTYFGSTQITSNFVNYEDIVGKGTNCLNTNDSAGYWTPTVFFRATGLSVPVRAFRAYYRCYDGRTSCPPADAHAYPPDTRLVAGYPVVIRATGWWCGQHNPQPLGPTFPTCAGKDAPGYELAGHVTFPTCWDGVMPNHSASDVGNTNDNAHYAYRITVNGHAACPAGFPNHMLELRHDVTLAYWRGAPGCGASRCTGNGANELVLSSDAANGTTAGRSWHGDFWNTWIQDGFEQMVADCITVGRDVLAMPRECD